MSWIKIRTDLRNHPKVVRMASGLKSDRLRTLGALQVVWGTFDTHSVDGLLEGYTLAAIDEDLNWRGFGAAMQSVGWLIESESGLEVPEFDTHNGTSAKKRAQDTKLKKSNREADKGANGSWMPDGQMSGDEPDKEQTGGGPEKELDKRKKKPTVSKGAKAPSFDAAFIDLPEWLEPEDWQRWCADRAARKKAITEEGAKAQLRKLDEYRSQGHSPASVIEHSIAGGFQGLYAPPRRVNGSHPNPSAQDARVLALINGSQAGEVIDV